MGIFNGLNPFQGIHIDPTPGFNIDRHAGGGVPFISKGDGSTGIAPPKPASHSTSSKPSAQPTQGTTTTYPGGSSGPSASDLAAYNTYQGEANSDLGRLLSSYNNTVGSLDSNFGKQNNQLDSAKAATQNTYNNNVTQQHQDNLREQNQVRQGTYNAYQALMSFLSAHGGGNTSLAQEWAPTAAQHYQNEQVGNANQTTAANLRGLDTAWGNYLNDYKNKKETLLDTHNQDVANAASTYNDTKAKLDLILNRIGSRALQPGDIGSALAGLNIPNVNFVQPSYTGTTPVYNAPNLSTFEAQAPTASFAQPAAVSNSSATPALAYLLDQQQQKQQQQPIAS